MQKFIKTFILLVAISSLNVMAESWKVHSVKGTFLLKSEEQGRIYSIQSDGGVPRFIKEENYKKGLRRIIYQSGTVGTSELYRVERALVVNEKTGKVYGDFLYRSIKLGSSGEELDASKAKWSYKDGILRVQDEAQGLDESLEINL